MGTGGTGGTGGDRKGVGGGLATDPTMAPGSPGPAASSDATLPATRAASSSTTTSDVELTEVPRTHYEVGAELARGGMGRILIARDRRMGRRVAVKELLGDGDGMAKRFAREALVTGRLQHPGIVPVYEAGRWPSGEPFYAMKLVAGQSLEKVIAGTKALEDRLALLPNIIQVAEAIAYAHGEQVIHRDLKPANVLVGAFGETVVIDWGLAKDLRDVTAAELPAGPYRSAGGEGLTMHGAVMGTPIYMPPEQARGEPVDARADVYAIGAMLYHTLTGRLPYAGKSADDIITRVLAGPPVPLPQAAPGLAGELATIVARAMAREPKDRYPTAKELADELVRFQKGQLVSSHRYSAWALVRRWVRRHRAAVIAAATLLVGAAVVGAVAIRQVVQARDRARAERLAAQDAQLASLEEQGRQELLANHPLRAAVYLAEAYRGGRHGLTLRLLLGAAMVPIDANVARLPAGAPLSFVRYSAGGARLVTLTADGGVQVWDAVTGAPVSTIAPRGGQVTTIAISPAGDRVLGAARDESVTIWDAATGTVVITLDEREGATGYAEFSPDGSRVLLLDSQAIDVVDAATGAPQVRIAAEEDTLQAATFTADGTRIVSAGAREILTWDARSGARLATVTTPADHQQMVIAPGGARVVGYVEAPEPEAPAVPTTEPGEPVEPAPMGYLELWDPTGKVPVVRTELYAPPDTMTFSSDGRHLLVTDTDGKIRLGDVTTASETMIGEYHEALPEDEYRTGPAFVAVAPDGRLVAVGAEDGRVNVWDDTGTRIAAWEAGGRPIDGLAFSPDGTQLASIGADGVGRLWRISPRPPVPQPPVATSRDGRRALTIDDDEMAVVRDTRTDAVVARFGTSVHGGRFGVDGRIVTISGRDGDVVRLWDAAGAPVASIPRSVMVLELSPDGTQLFVTTVDGAQLWDVARGVRTALLVGHEDYILGARFSPDGGRLVTWSKDATARLWDTRTGALLATFTHLEFVLSARFDATGTRVVTASGDGTAAVWDAATGARIASLAGHTARVHDAMFSPDGARVLTAADTRARVWDARSGAMLLELDHAGVDMYEASFSADGALILSQAGDDDWLWDAQRGALLYRGHEVKAMPRVRIGSPGLAIVAGVRFRGPADDQFVAATALPLPLETRAPAVVAALVAQVSPWRLEGGRLVPAGTTAYHTSESVSSRAKHYDFSGDTIEGEVRRPAVDAVTLVPPGQPIPGMTSVPGGQPAAIEALRSAALAPAASDDAVARYALALFFANDYVRAAPALDRVLAAHPGAATPEQRILRAWVAIVQHEPAVAQPLIAGLTPATAGSPLATYLLGWSLFLSGDAAGAYQALLATARTAPRPSTRASVIKEALVFGGWAAVPPDTLLADLRALDGRPDAELLRGLVDAYDVAGEIELEQQTLAVLVATGAPALIAQAQYDQAALANGAGEPTLAARLLVEALHTARRVPQTPADTREAIVALMRESALAYHSTYSKTYDQRYADAARLLYHTFIGEVGGPHGNEMAQWAVELDYSLTMSGNSTGQLDKAIVRRPMRFRIRKMRACYERVLQRAPTIAGTVRLVLVISSTGRVSAVTTHPHGGPEGLQAVAACVAAEAAKVVFPRPAYAGTLIVEYPFEFQTAGGE